LHRHYIPPQRLDGKIRQEKDTIALLEREQQALEQRAAQDQVALQGAQSLLDAVERCLGQEVPMEVCGLIQPGAQHV
jgi:FtsZ-binding cell division protein ZapB